MMDNASASGSGLPAFVAVAKDVVSLLRDGVLVGLVVLLMVLPKTFNARLIEAGFQQADLMGMEWKSGLVNSNDALAVANKSISDLQDQNAQLLKKLQDVGQTATSPAVKEQITKMTDDATQLKAATQGVKEQVSQAIATNTQLFAADPAQAAAAPKPSRKRSDYLVGLQTVGAANDARLTLNDRIQKAGYGLHSLSASYEVAARPTWFAPRSTVFYYSDSALPAAQALATFMKSATKQEFQVQRGAGLGVDPSEKDVTLFVHYVKE